MKEAKHRYRSLAGDVFEAEIVRRGLDCVDVEAIFPSGRRVEVRGVPLLGSDTGARDASLVAIDSSPAMARVYAGPGQFVVADAAEFDFAAWSPDLVVCFLALMFVPVSKRAALVERMKDAVRVGGAVVVFDKMEPATGYVGTVAYRLTLAAKHEAGARPAEVIAKELSISGLQRPMRAGELAGFVEVFRFGDFAGWIYERA